MRSDIAVQVPSADRMLDLVRFALCVLALARDAALVLGSGSSGNRISELGEPVRPW
jgi:hypothetical protein